MNPPESARSIVVNDTTLYCRNKQCAVPLRRSRSVALLACCCCRSDHAPDVNVIVDLPVAVTLPAATGTSPSGTVRPLGSPDGAAAFSAGSYVPSGSSCDRVGG